MDSSVRVQGFRLDDIGQRSEGKGSEDGCGLQRHELIKRLILVHSKCGISGSVEPVEGSVEGSVEDLAEELVEPSTPLGLAHNLDPL